MQCRKDTEKKEKGALKNAGVTKQVDAQVTLLRPRHQRFDSVLSPAGPGSDQFRFFTLFDGSGSERVLAAALPFTQGYQEQRNPFQKIAHKT